MLDKRLRHSALTSNERFPVKEGSLKLFALSGNWSVYKACMLTSISNIKCSKLLRCCHIMQTAFLVRAHSCVWCQMLASSPSLSFAAVEIYRCLFECKLVKFRNAMEIIHPFSNSRYSRCQFSIQSAVAARHGLINHASLYSVAQTVRLYSPKHNFVRRRIYLHWGSKMWAAQLLLKSLLWGWQCFHSGEHEILYVWLQLLLLLLQN